MLFSCNGITIRAYNVVESIHYCSSKNSRMLLLSPTLSALNLPHICLSSFVVVVIFNNKIKSVSGLKITVPNQLQKFTLTKSPC